MRFELEIHHARALHRRGSKRHFFTAPAPRFQHRMPTTTFASFTVPFGATPPVLYHARDILLRAKSGYTAAPWSWPGARFRYRILSSNPEYSAGHHGNDCQQRSSPSQNTVPPGNNLVIPFEQARATRDVSGNQITLEICRRNTDLRHLLAPALAALRISLVSYSALRANILKLRDAHHNSRISH